MQEEDDIMKDRMKTFDAKCLLEDLGTIERALVRAASAALMSGVKSRPTGRRTPLPTA